MRREGAVDDKGTSLIMRDGEVQRKTRDGNVSVINFDSYSFDLSDLTENRGQATLRASDRDLTFLFNPGSDRQGLYCQAGNIPRRTPSPADRLGSAFRLRAYLSGDRGRRTVAS